MYSQHVQSYSQCISNLPSLRQRNLNNNLTDINTVSPHKVDMLIGTLILSMILFLMLYQTLVRSQLEYANCLWSACFRYK